MSNIKNYSNFSDLSSGCGVCYNLFMTDNIKEENKEPAATESIEPDKEQAAISAPLPSAVPADAVEPKAGTTAPEDAAGAVDSAAEKPIEVLTGETTGVEIKTEIAEAEEKPAETTAGEIKEEEQPEISEPLPAPEEKPAEPEPEPRTPTPEQPVKPAPEPAGSTAKPVVGFWNKLKELRALGNKARTKKKEENLAKALAYARERNKITNDEVQEITGVGDTQATNYLNQLVKERKLVRFGSTSFVLQQPLCLPGDLKYSYK